MGGEWVWFDNGRGRQVLRKVYDTPPPARSDLPCPMIKADTIEPTMSMADGKYYTSKAGLRGSYLPSGNPQGERYIEIGNEAIKAPPPPKPDRKSIRQSVEKAFGQAGVSI